MGAPAQGGQQVTPNQSGMFATGAPVTIGGPSITMPNGVSSGDVRISGLGGLIQAPAPTAPAGGPLVPMPQVPTGGGKGGGGTVGRPMPRPTQGQFAPLAPQGGFNVNQASAGALQRAMQGTQAGMGFQAPRTTAFGYTPTTQTVQGQQTGFGYDPAQRRGFTLAGQNIAQYESPYQQAVIDRTLQDLGGAQEQALNVLGQQATAARAFGGSRQGIAEAETRKGFAEQAAETVANLRERGFQQALGAAQFDVGQLAGTEAANIAAQQAAQQFGATSAQAAQAANIQRAQQVAASNAAAQTAAAQYMAQQRQAAQQQNFANQLAALQARQGAASQLAGLGQQAFNIGQTIQQQQAQQGLLQQGLQQALIDAARQQYGGYVGSPAAALQAPLAALGVVPSGGGTTTKSKQPGFFDYAALAATAASRICWVAREVYGEDDPKWLQFRDWVVGASPDWFFNLYSKHGEKVAEKVKRNPWTKKVLRPLMDIARKSLGYK